MVERLECEAVLTFSDVPVDEIDGVGNKFNEVLEAIKVDLAKIKQVGN